MSEDLINYINSLNVRTYFLACGRTIIGRLIDSHEHQIEVNSPLEVHMIDHSDLVTEYVMIPLLPSNQGETMIINREAIDMETSVSFELKKRYCDALMMQKLSKLALDLISDDDTASDIPDDIDDISLDSSDFDLEYYKQQYPNRNWKLN